METILGLIAWLVGIVLAFAGVGIHLYYHGKALERPQQSRRIGREMRIAGWWWVGIAFSLFLASGILCMLLL
jgi:hypothetical protein